MNWRTHDVVALCAGMRETGDYSALPILADALQDADFSDETMLAALRAPQDATASQRFVAMIYSDETAAAVAKVEELATELGERAFCEEGDGYGERKPTDYGRLMRIGDRWSNTDEWGGESTVEHGDEGLRDGDFNHHLNAFWEAYQTITGKHAEGNPFGCSC